ncbi:hypothetical protein TNCV_2776531 [Trichonephila clavipes]|nr:hypothetical protein TNCV_2776531 [Trichonephila clavipes]
MDAAVAEWCGCWIAACLAVSSSPVPLKTRRVGQRCTLNLLRAETSSRRCGVVVRRKGASSAYKRKGLELGNPERRTRHGFPGALQDYGQPTVAEHLIVWPALIRLNSIVQKYWGARALMP